MRRILTGLSVALMVAGVPAIISAAPARRNNATATAGQRKPKTDNHPKIREAIAALEAAKTELEQSTGDFGGHKAEAIEAVNNALKRLRLALQFEKY
jgi:hypothetical protein